MTQSTRMEDKTAQTVNTPDLTHQIEFGNKLTFIIAIRQTVGKCAAAVGLAGRKNKCRHDGPDAHQIEQRRLFVARVGRFLARLEYVRLEPKCQLVCPCV